MGGKPVAGPVVTDLPCDLADYLAARQRRRRERAETMWGRFTAREQHLVREASVMGFVQGVRASGAAPPDPFPGDRDVVVEVLDAVVSFPDLYPTLAALGDAPAHAEEETTNEKEH